MKKKSGICFLAAVMSAMACDCNNFQSKDGCPAPAVIQSNTQILIDEIMFYAVIVGGVALCIWSGACVSVAE